MFGLSKAALDAFVAFGLLFRTIFVVDMQPVFVIYAASSHCSPLFSFPSLHTPRTSIATTTTITFYVFWGLLKAKPPSLTRWLKHFGGSLLTVLTGYNTMLSGVRIKASADR